MRPVSGLAFALAVAALLISPTPARGAEIILCHVSCVCITWISGASAYTEVRCRDGSAGGWAAGPTAPPDGSDGSWVGTGTPMAPPSPLPGNVLSPEAGQAVGNAKTA